ncbi:hypothetical protein Tco_0010130 [Tanacetum coccineum]
MQVTLRVNPALYTPNRNVFSHISAAVKKKDSQKRKQGAEGSSIAKKKRVPVGTKDATASTGHISSPTPLQTVALGEESPPRMEPLVNLSRQPTHPPKEPVFATGVNVGGSLRLSNTLSTGVPESYPRTMLMDDMLRKVSPLGTLLFIFPDGTFLEGTDMLERFKNLLADYDNLAEAHAECSETVRKLVTTRLNLEHNAKLYNNAINRLRTVGEEHAARIVSLEVELAKKDYTLTYSDRLLAEGARERERLIVQLGQAEIEKFDCIWKLLPIVVGRLLKSHEYKESLLGPFNMAIQAGWGKGLSEGCTDEEIMVALSWVEEFDAYFDKKLYSMYDKLFEKQYPYVQKIARGYRHSVADLLKVYLDPAPSQGTSNPNTSKAFGRSNPPLPKKT